MVGVLLDRGYQAEATGEPWDMREGHREEISRQKTKAWQKP